MICVSLTSSDLGQLRKDIAKAAQVADAIEIRLDYLPVNADLSAILGARPKPIIVTCRRVDDGGKYDRDQDLDDIVWTVEPESGGEDQ